MSQRFSCNHNFLENAVLGQALQVARLYWVWLKEMKRFQNIKGKYIFIFHSKVNLEPWRIMFHFFKERKFQKLNESSLLGRESAIWLGVSTFINRKHIFQFGMTPSPLAAVAESQLFTKILFLLLCLQFPVLFQWTDHISLQEKTTVNVCSTSWVLGGKEPITQSSYEHGIRNTYTKLLRKKLFPTRSWWEDFKS